MKSYDLIKEKNPEQIIIECVVFNMHFYIYTINLTTKINPLSPEEHIVRLTDLQHSRLYTLFY